MVNHSLLIVLIFYYAKWSFADMFTSLEGMKKLLITHKTVTDDLENYVQGEISRLEGLKQILNNFKEVQKNIHLNPEFIENPLNCFILIKRLTLDLDLVESITTEKSDFKRNGSLVLPNSADLDGAVSSMEMLQTTYKLNVSELAYGLLSGNFTHGNRKYIEQTLPYTAGDCYVLARGSYRAKFYSVGLPWMLEAYHKYKAGDNVGYRFVSNDILYGIIFGYYKLGDDGNAMEWTQKLIQNHDGVFDKPIIKLNTKYEWFQNLIFYFKVLGFEDWIKRFWTVPLSWMTWPPFLAERFKKRLYIRELLKENKKKFKEIFPSATSATEFSDEDTGDALCRGEMELPSDTIKSLKCRYLTETHPFLRLAPVKLEQLYFDPDVVVLHDVMSDDEIQKIKELAMPALARAQVLQFNIKQDVPSKDRVTQVAWLNNSKHDVAARVSRRVSHFTGLSETGMEPLQVANYGIGGWYSRHYDFTTKKESMESGRRYNRLATVLFYMSDVPQGGATVFPKLGLTVFPEKGAALVWTNLHTSGEGNFALLHAACPVLRGSKWVSTIWIRQEGQELIRPCNLVFQKEGLHRNFPPPLLKTRTCK